MSHPWLGSRGKGPEVPCGESCSRIDHFGQNGRFCLAIACENLPKIPKILFSPTFWQLIGEVKSTPHHPSKHPWGPYSKKASSQNLALAILLCNALVSAVNWRSTLAHTGLLALFTHASHGSGNPGPTGSEMGPVCIQKAAAKGAKCSICEHPL